MAYTGYDRIYHHQEVVEVACNAHARRKFFEAKDGDDPAGAHRALARLCCYSLEYLGRNERGPCLEFAPGAGAGGVFRTFHPRIGSGQIQAIAARANPSWIVPSRRTPLPRGGETREGSSKPQEAE